MLGSLLKNYRMVVIPRAERDLQLFEILIRTADSSSLLEMTTVECCSEGREPIAPRLILY
jgi:hypothetical protein